MLELVNVCYSCKIRLNINVEATKRRSGGWVCEHCIVEMDIAELRSDLAHYQAANQYPTFNYAGEIDVLTTKLATMGDRIPLDIQ